MDRSLLLRFPAIRHLGADRLLRRIPALRQLSATECGAVCLAMVLGYHGRRVRLDEVREVVGVGRDGTTARDLVRAARSFGLLARGVRIDVDDLGSLEPATILHWQFNHFVVFDRVRDGHVEIVDPGAGRRRVRMEEFRRSFTGIAIHLSPREDFQRGGSRELTALRCSQVLLADPASTRILVTTVMLQLLGLSVPAVTGTLVDRVVPRSDHHLFVVLGVGVAGIVGFHFAASLVRSHLLLHLRSRLDARMALTFFAHLMDLPYAFFQQRSVGDLAMRINSIGLIREILSSATLSTLVDGGFAAASIAVLLVAHPAMGALTIALCACQCVVFLASRSRQRELLGEDLEKQSRAQACQVEVLSSMQTLKAMGCEDRAEEQWSHLYVDVLNATLARGRVSALADALSGTLRLAAPLVLLGYGVWAVLHGELSLGAMLALCALAAGVLGPAAGLVGVATQLQMLTLFAERLADVLEAPREQGESRPPAGALKGRVELDGVSFRYGAHAPWVVQDVSVAIEPGMFVAIVGPSGSGKSTLARLLLGLHAPTAGVVRYDGIDLERLDRRSVRRQIGLVPQEAHLFAGSIRSNIALAAPDASLGAVRRAAEIACIDGEIAALPMGYETLLADGGAGLSGGQRQRVALARALVRDPAVLLLDEATSALDAATEAQVKARLSSFGRTRIVIAHRLSTISEADLILVMENGRLVEQGRHAELLSREGAYARLVRAQLG
ncbi:peptidase domain-containing ABC transporter [Sorangium sp. So ce131]|uniref:peptidase domain-containing ABC transporter n=1 Tax=Sorangium sp. So ce131 TaxID=3133282 RepID=UPI003F5EA6E5